jgi:hypothetical protein
MIKTEAFSFLRYNRFEFGEQVISQFVVFEYKWLFSIIFFYFHKSKGSQDRFHTHAFNAISFKIFGMYHEHKLLSEETGFYQVKQRKNIIQYFPRNSYHRIAQSNGCLTMLLSGPWKKTWKEYIDGKVIHYNWGRNGKKETL